MPRGVPANGFRQPRHDRSGAPPEPAVAGGAGDDTVDRDDPTGEQATPETPEADELISLADMQPIVVPQVEPVAVPEQVPVVELIPETTPVVTSLPDAQLTAEQREIKALRDQLARERGKKDTEPHAVELASPGDASNIVIHFLEDGLTALGKVMYRGDELEFEVGSPAYKDTFDRFGRTWLDLRLDEFTQAERWGKIMFRNGPWPGKTYVDGTFESLRSDREGVNVKPPTADELIAAEKLRLQRAAPRLPSNV